MLQVSHLSKEYGPFRAVDDISFTARQGEILAFLGPNGAGKSTTMRMITGSLPPTAGEVKVDGWNVREHPLEVKRRIGYLPELPPLYPELSVNDYLMFVAQLKQIPGRQRKAAVERACRRAAISDVRHRIIGRLSKGYRQRVGIAQAILHDPPLLVLDEPTAGLDPRQILETRQLIQELAGQHTIILSTHILSEAASTCERVIIINKGKLVAEDRTENLTHRLQGGELLSVSVRGPADEVAGRLQSLEGVRRVERAAYRDGSGRWQVEAADATVREAIARTIVQAGWGLLELKPVELSLEEIFLSLTGAGAAADTTTTVLQ